MTGLSSVILAILMIAGFVLAGGGVYVLAKRGDRTKAALMIVAALVMWGNVAIMTL
jgi:hypothetical protein